MAEGNGPAVEPGAEPNTEPQEPLEPKGPQEPREPNSNPDYKAAYDRTKAERDDWKQKYADMEASLADGKADIEAVKAQPRRMPTARRSRRSTPQRCSTRPSRPHWRAQAASTRRRPGRTSTLRSSRSKEHSGWMKGVLQKFRPRTAQIAGNVRFSRHFFPCWLNGHCIGAGHEAALFHMLQLLRPKPYITRDLC
ncbi:MAG: hypothetical protein FWD72_03045 [Eggerthellaceae bacterium]|nr:hypothetical protein [Eggerthellaceae bacterium]